MKKFTSLLLTVALVAASMVIPATAATVGTAPAGLIYDADLGEYVAPSGVVSEVIADLDFEDAVMDFTAYATQDEDAETYTVSVPSGSYVPVVSTNKAETDLTINVNTWSNEARTSSSVDTPALSSTLQGFFYRPATESDNTYLAPSDRKRQARMQITVDQYNDESASYDAAGVTNDETEVVYLDYRVKRVNATNDDSVSITISDSSSHNIAVMSYSQNNYPSLTASTTYGGDSFSAETPATNYCSDGSWQCVRFVMNFTTHTFKLYVGNDWSELKPYITDNENYTMASTSATNLYKLKIGDKGSLAIDDVAIYKVVPPVAPVASDAVLTGKPNLDETLSCTYTYSCSDGALEGDSYCYWEAADNTAFSNAITLTDEIPVTADEAATYTIDAAASGKYVRCVIVPVSVSGIEGDELASNATSYMVDNIVFSPYVSGNIKGGTYWDFKWGSNDYKGGVSITSTLSEPVTYTLIGAWYVTETDEATGKSMQRLTGVKILPVTVDSANTTDSGVVTASFTTDTVQSVPKGGNGYTNTMKVMVVDSITTMNPACDYVYAGSNF